MKCLIGEYNKAINVKIKDYENINIPDAKYHYLCSVADYKSNIHLAFREKKGNEIIIDNEFFSIKISDAEQIQIDNNSINYELPQSKNRLFNTCRNWWFANWVKNKNEKIE